MIIYFYLIYWWDANRVELGVMAMKGYSSFPKDLHSWFSPLDEVYCYIQDNRWEGLTPCKKAVIMFYSPSRLGGHFVGFSQKKFFSY